MEPRSANEENQAAIQSQKVETGKDGKCAEVYSLPLFYFSFELIRQMIKASKQKQKLEDMVHSINLCGKQEDKEEHLCNHSPFIDTSGICDEELGHKEGGNSSQINSLFDFSLSKISSHREGLCWFDAVEERVGLHAEAYKESEVPTPEVLNERVDVSF